MKKVLILGSILVLFSCLYFFELHRYLDLSYVKANADSFQRLLEQKPLQVSLAYFFLYVLVTGLSIPGATILTLAGGWVFGFWKGLFIVSFASTLGASLAFLASRYLFRDFIQKKFSAAMRSINKGIKKDGNFYLFALRLVPIFPFFLINLGMGLTKQSLVSFFFVSQLAMLPGTMAYVNAGLQLSKIQSLKGLLSFDLLFAFAVLGVFPLLGKSLLQMLRNRKVYAPYKFLKPKSFDYDLVVIGAGSAGLVSAYIGSAVKAKVALIERDKMGGDCLNTGCVPSKSIIRSAHAIHEMKHADRFGIDSVKVDFRFEKIMQRVQEKISKIEPHDSVDRYEKLGVECIRGEAKVLNPWTVQVASRTLKTRNIIIASGASPVIPDLPGLEKVPYVHSESLWNLKTLPKKLLVLGGGPIGCEMAQTFQRLGSQVTLVEKGDRLLRKDSKEASSLILKVFKEEGMDVRTEHRAKEFRKEGEQCFLVCEHKEEDLSIAFDTVLIALGRKARVEGFGLESLGIALKNKQTILVNDYLQTQYPNIYACGDVVGPYQFTHAASHQAWFCAVNALFGGFKKFRVDYRVMPWCTFTDPEVANVGLTENEALEKNIPYEVTKYSLEDLDRAITDNNETGFVKVLTVPEKDEILGASIVGAQAGNLITEFVTAMKHGIGLNKTLGTIHIYPTMAEANKFAAGVWKKNHAPASLLKVLSQYFKWRRKG